MSPAFQRLPLGNVARHRKEFIQIDDLTTYKRCRVQLHAQGIVLRDIILGSEIKTKKQQICHGGQFLVAEIDAKVGGFGVVPDQLSGAIVSSHYFLFDLNEALLDRRFLDFFVRTPGFGHQVRAQGSTNYAAIRPEDVLEYQIPLPPLSEQRRIVARIEDLAAKIEEARGLRRQAAEEAEALWVSGARALISELSKANVKPLGNLVNVKGGGTPSKSNLEFWDGSVPWVTPKDMKSRELYDSVDHISEHALQNSSAKLIDPGAVLIVVRGMILAHTVPISVLRVAAAINQDMKALVPDGEITPEYLSSTLWALNAGLLALVEKSTHDTRKLETPKLLDFPIPLPPLPEQRLIVDYLDDLELKVDSLKRLQAQTSAELDAMLPSILDKAFRGEL